MSSPLDYSRYASPEHDEPYDHEFTVEIMTGIRENRGWELWSEGLDWKEVESDTALLKKRGFDYRVWDERGKEWEL